ncbi:aspartate 1-decarboxylase autocleavage activator PanM [Pantoea sp. ACRSB]|uniref:aspartate 1-decarboxylase autocleavage activator PanM n=1 Tax=Pantoea sp. ACRSB TaxID=2918207 RepID=UPI0028935D98|nr:aspartate 1-decarboxylase autocleavage activator PanM [Pantoea sp. ACRSB]MCG7390313.1 aspartate 1-decarboxylase autocleavage activator PanM [Pantoea sp. ACRSB]
MKLTILRLTTFSPQDQIDLAKIWPNEDIAALEKSLSENQRLYAARFNERLLGALKLEIVGAQGKISQLEVREVTRRRGVGQYLMEETMAQNGSVSSWWVADDGSANQGERAAFMQACGFRAQSDGWVK